MLDVNPSLTPALMRDALLAASPLPGASIERQGAGALDAAWAYGRPLTIDQAIATALGEPA